MDYGKIVNGQLRKAPQRMTYNGCNSDSHPKAVYRQFGYKPVKTTNPPEKVPAGKMIQSGWNETNEEIEQVWEIVDLPDDYAEIYRKAKGRFNLSLLSLRGNIESYRKQKDEEIQRLLSDEVMDIAYQCLQNKYPGENIKQMMDHYAQSVPINFFRELGMVESLKTIGFITHYYEPIFATDKGMTYSASKQELFDYVDGNVFLKESGEQLFFINTYCAYRLTTDKQPTIIDPFLLYMALRDVADKYESAYGNCMQYTMAYCYLHTIMDEFLTSTLRFYIQSYPSGVDLKDVPADKVMKIKSMEELRMCQEEAVEEKMSALGHKSFEEKIGVLKKRGIECKNIKQAWLDDMIWFCEKRNALVHNSGIINPVIISKLKNTQYHGSITVGTNVLPTYKNMEEALDTVNSFCNDLYSVMQEKFHI